MIFTFPYLLLLLVFFQCFCVYVIDSWLAFFFVALNGFLFLAPFNTPLKKILLSRILREEGRKQQRVSENLNTCFVYRLEALFRLIRTEKPMSTCVYTERERVLEAILLIYHGHIFIIVHSIICWVMFHWNRSLCSQKMLKLERRITKGRFAHTADANIWFNTLRWAYWKLQNPPRFAALSLSLSLHLVSNFNAETWTEELSCR